MTDHCPSCPFKGCPDCRYQGGTHDPSSLINHEGRPVDAAARVLYELRHPPDDECTSSHWRTGNRMPHLQPTPPARCPVHGPIKARTPS